VYFLKNICEMNTRTNVWEMKCVTFVWIHNNLMFYATVFYGYLTKLNSIFCQHEKTSIWNLKPLHSCHAPPQINRQPMSFHKHLEWRVNANGLFRWEWLSENSLFSASLHFALRETGRTEKGRAPEPRPRLKWGGGGRKNPLFVSIYRSKYYRTTL
jgi:hypothetical protein